MPDFSGFARKACIPSLSKEFTALPVERDSFNDILIIDSFKAADLTFADRQRKGIHTLLEDAPSIKAHIAAAMRQEFPLAMDAPLPPSLQRTALLIKHSPEKSIIQFWDQQLLRLRNLVAEAVPFQKAWGDSISLKLRPAAGKLQTIALKQLFPLSGINGMDWLDQFAVGFPITGKLSQNQVYPTDASVRSPRSVESIFASSAHRFRERAAKSGFKNSGKLWEEAMGQVQQGWLEEPAKLTPDGLPAELSGDAVNIAFRFRVSQAEKLRACDDLRHSLTNETCAVMTPTQLVSSDHIAQLFKLLRGDGRSWHLLKADHEAAYKQLPLRLKDQGAAVIALRHPESSLWYSFKSRTLMFGAVAAVLHYNCFARSISSLACILFGIPLVSYFDDFAALLPSNLARKALSVFSSFCETLGITLKQGKSEVGPRITFLGLRGSFPSKANDFQLGISLPPEKAAKWATAIASLIKARSVSHQQLESLIGKLSFSQTQLFAKFARTQLRPLYQKLHRKVYNARLTDLELHTLRWWEVTIRSLTPRRVCTLPKSVKWILYTDAATNPPRICALLFEGTTSTTQLWGEWASDVPIAWCNIFHRTNLILGLELLALVAFFEQLAPRLSGQSVWVYVDNNNVLAAVTRGDSNTETVAVLVANLWDTLQRHSICAWFSRVPAALNPADLPTRGRMVPFPARFRGNFTSLVPLLRSTRNSLRTLHPHRPNRLRGGRRVLR